MVALLDASPEKAANQRYNEQHNRHPKYDLSGYHCCSSDGTESEHRSDDGDNQKHHGPIEKSTHNVLLLTIFSTRITFVWKGGFSFGSTCRRDGGQMERALLDIRSPPMSITSRAEHVNETGKLGGAHPI
jgi:hypothetical protein